MKPSFVEPAADGAGIFGAEWPFDACAFGCGFNEDIRSLE